MCGETKVQVSTFEEMNFESQSGGLYNSALIQLDIRLYMKLNQTAPAYVKMLWEMSPGKVLDGPL